MKSLNITVQYLFKNSRCVRPQSHMTYDVTRTTFSASFAENNQANFSESFENSQQITHHEFSKTSYIELVTRSCSSSLRVTVLEKLIVAKCLRL
jgi:hypothetical protein